MIDVTDIKVKADALAVAANVVMTMRAAPTGSTLAQALAALTDSQNAFYAWTAAVNELQTQFDTDHPFQII